MQSISGGPISVRKNRCFLLFVNKYISFLAELTANFNVKNGIYPFRCKGYIETEVNFSINENIKKYAADILLDKNKSNHNDFIMGNYISDPIVGIKIADMSGTVIVNVDNDMDDMHSGMMMRSSTVKENDSFILSVEDVDIGFLVITRNSKIQNAETVLLFKNALMVGTMISGVIVLIIAATLTYYISVKMTREMIDISNKTKLLDSSHNHFSKYSSIVEVKNIQLTIDDLSSKLKLQKKTRKENIDKLSHESRTPLTILKTNCEGAIDGVVEMDEKRLESCLNQIENLSLLIEDIPNIVEYEKEFIEIKSEKIDLISELNKIIKGLKVQYEKKNISLILEHEEDIILHSDKSLLDQIMYNLLNNAYKFTEKGGSVKITAKLRQGKVYIRVNDSGIGISSEEIANVFNAYYRSENVLDIHGDGLGLYIVQKNTEALKGTVEIRSELGKGTVVELSFEMNENNI